MDKLYQLLRETGLENQVKIRYKDQSSFMRFLGIVLYPMNRHFMTHYTSTIGNTVYFPSEKYVQEDEVNALRVLAHELVHVLDSQDKGKIWFSLGYLFPQILGVVGLAGFVEPWAFLFFLALLPWPAPFRFHWEARAYTISWLSRYPRPAPVEVYFRYFTGWDYYRMYPFPMSIQDKMHFWQVQVEGKEDVILSRVLQAYRKVRESHS